LRLHSIRPGAADDGHDAVHLQHHERRRCGVLSSVALALLRGRWRDLNPLLSIIAVAFAVYFIDGLLV
jgi:hypothetical protein